MAATPIFTSAPRLLAGLVPGTADTSWTAPANKTSLGSGVTAGTKIIEIDVIPVGTVVAGIVNIFVYDGTTYSLWESVTISAATLSTTAAPVKQVFTYDNLVLPSSSWSLAVTNTVAGNVSLVKVIAIGADFT